MKRFLASLTLMACAVAHADSVDTLRGFLRDVKTASATFTQTVTSPEGKQKLSSGSFEFSRPNRFRFGYEKPYQQLIVADGEKVWIFDADLNQVSTRKLSAAIGATPAALLAGGSLDKDFDLKALPSAEGLDWVEALPKQKDGAFQSLRVGFEGKDLAAFEIHDAFGQKSLLKFSGLQTNPTLAADRFRFTVPKGADVIDQ